MLGVTVVVGMANATVSSGVTSKLMSQNRANGKGYIIREVTLARGGCTGWHSHEGTLYVPVKEGRLNGS